jgi:ubiquinone/menaquinone biosynthesis C-methylase UbiE
MRAILCVLPWLLVACASEPKAPVAPTAPAAPAAPVAAAAPTAPAAPLAGAKPEINADFRKPDMDVASWVQRFEAESREIAAHRDDIAAVLALKPGEAVADIGAGTGLFEEPFTHAVGAKGTVYAVDISPAFLDHLRQRAKDASWTQVQVVACDDRSTKLAPASVDAAFICDTYHHFEHPADTLASLLRAIKPGGRLVVVDFEREPGQSRDWVLDHVRCGKAQVKAEIEQAGFRFTREATVPGLTENYVIEFAAPR